tara:strand:+ start:3923 stop:4408 length:486 start_codon:yes stop_codon:yes gene_type:complete
MPTKRSTICFILLTLSIAEGHTSTCEVPQKIQRGKVAIDLVADTFTSNTDGSTRAFFKLPRKGKQIHSADWINCDGFVPGGATIRSIQIKAIMGLPDGLEWMCDKASCTYIGGASGCITFAGKPVTKNRYPLDIRLVGAGSYWGVKKSLQCSIETVTLVVD